MGLVGAVLGAAVLAGCQATPSITPTAAVSAAPTGAPTRSPAGSAEPLAVEARVAELLGRMTLDEKIGQMTLVEKDSIDPEGVRDALVGGVLSGGGGAPATNTAAGWHEMVQGFQDAALGTRLRIPILYGVDAVHGHNNVPGATIFPHNVGLGAAGDPRLVQQIGEATAREMAATGIRWDFGPVVAVPQDIRWGRTYEGYGEDPALVERLGASFITGLQGGDRVAPGSGLATAKHFVGDGGTGWSTSTTAGYSIDQGVTLVDDAMLRSVHLRPYSAAISAGVQVVMTSFSSTPAGKVHGDRRLLTDVLKGELGFTGFVVSDWGGVDQVDPNYDAAVVRSVSAGIDMVMVPYDYRRFQASMRAGVASGAIAPDRIDDAVRRILRVKVEMGLFDQPMPPLDEGALGSTADRQLARQAAAASAVLLKATRGTLPVGQAGRVLLAGPAADDIGIQSGGWTVSWQGSAGPITVGTTIRAGLAARLGDRLAYSAVADFAPGDRAPLGILVVGERPYAGGKGDSGTLALPADDLALLAPMRAHVDRLVVVVISGRPVMLDELADSADAIVGAWLPGSEGTGIVDALLGDRPFTGRTPYTWPVRPEDAPRTGRAPCDGAVYPVGYGLDAAGALLGPAACPAAGR